MRVFDLLRSVLLLLGCVAVMLAVRGVFAPKLWLAAVVGLPALYWGRILWFGLTGR
jgi:hypothetical protein